MGEENPQSSSAQTFMAETHSLSFPSSTAPNKIPDDIVISPFSRQR